MNALNLTIGQELELSELFLILEQNNHVDLANNLAAEEIANSGSLDNYDGDNGYNVCFDVISRETKGFGAMDYIVRVTDIFTM